MPSVSSAHAFRRVFVRCRQALGMTQHELGEALGVSRRTIIRWQVGTTSPVDDQMRQLANLVRAEDEDLADELLASASEAFGFDLEPPPAAPQPDVVAAPAPPRAPSGPAPAHVIHSILCVAADAANMVPREMKPALRAAFLRTRELGVDIDAVLQGLADTP